jgi:hypothetical protein
LNQPPDRHALIVAVSNYRDAKLRALRAPGADARRLATVLGDPAIGGFDVAVAENEEQPQLARRIARFFANRRADDLLLLHFSCHGIKDERGELYLAATDTEVDLLSATALSASWLNEQISRSRARRSVVLLDCCFSGSFPFGARVRSGGTVDVGAHLEGRGRAILTASNSMEYAFEGDQRTGEGQPSVFTSAVVEALETGEADRDGDRWISVDELYEYVYARVREHTPSQSPNMMTTVEGALRIARSKYQPPVEAAPLGEELQSLLASPYVGARLGAVEELAALLRSPEPGLALAARQALEELAGDDSRRVSERVGSLLAERSREPGPPVEPVRAVAERQTSPSGLLLGQGPWTPLLAPTESVLLTATCVLDVWSVRESNVVLTDQRLLVERKGRIQKSIPHRALVSVAVKRTLAGNRSPLKRSTLVLFHRPGEGLPDERYKISQIVPDDAARSIGEYLEQQIRAG